MQINTQAYVRFYYHGIMVDETQELEVEYRDINSLEIPDNAFGFSFFDIVSTTGERPDGTEVKLTSEPVNESPMFYPGGRVLTLAQVRQADGIPNQETIIANMEINSHARVVITRRGGARYFNREDIFLSE